MIKYFHMLNKKKYEAGINSTQADRVGRDLLFDAFASYATDPDRDIVRDVAAFLEGLHENPLIPKPYRYPLRICVDGQDFKFPRPRSGIPQTDHEAAVATLIKSYLRQSRYLLLFTGPQSRSHPWVNRELDWWLEIKGAEAGAATVMIAVTHGSAPASERPTTFPDRVLDLGLDNQVWFDLRGFSRRTRHSARSVRLYEEEKVKIAASLMGDDVTPTALLEPWRAAHAKQQRRRRLVLGLAASVFLAVVSFGGWAIFQQAIENEASRIWTLLEFDSEGSPTEPAIRALWDLTTRGPSVRDALLKQLAEEPILATKLSMGSPYIVRGFGLQANYMDLRKLLTALLSVGAQSNGYEDLLRSYYSMQPVFISLNSILLQREIEQLEYISYFLENITQAISCGISFTRHHDPASCNSQFADYYFQTNNDAFRILCNSMKAFLPRIRPDFADAYSRHLVDLVPNVINMPRPIDFQTRSLCWSVVGLLAERGTSQGNIAILPSIFDYIVSPATRRDINSATRSDQYNENEVLLSTVKLLTTKVALTETEIAYKMTLEAITKAKDYDQLELLAIALAGLGANLTSEQADVAFQRLFNEVNRLHADYNIMAPLFATLKLTPKQAKIALPLMIDALAKEFDPYEKDIVRPRSVLTLSRAVANLGPSPEQIKSAREEVLAAFRMPDLDSWPGQPVLRTNPPPTDEEIGWAKGLLAQAAKHLGVTPEQSDQIVRELRFLLRKAKPDAAVTLAEAVGNLLTPYPIESFVREIVELLKWPTSAAPEATNVLLEILRTRAGGPGKDAGLAATLRWIAGRWPSIDLEGQPHDMAPL